MHRRNFLRGLIASPAAALVPVVPPSTRTIVDLGANTWRRTDVGLWLPCLIPSDVLMYYTIKRFVKPLKS